MSWTKAAVASAVWMFPEASSLLLAERQLLRRIDSKFVVHGPRLAALLDGLGGDYAALRVPSGCVASYQSLYVDSPELRCFHDHRRGRRVRHKVRYRHYPDRRLSFLEVKSKRNDRVTDKHRLDLAYGCERPGERELGFLRDRLGPMADTLAPIVRVHYSRVSLLGIGSNERVTIDFDLEVLALDGTRRPLGPISVIEIKQATFSLATPVMRALGAAKLRPSSVSKYAVAVALTRPGERSNRLLPKLRQVQRISE